ncbi:MAG: bacteriohemerythrin [Proteobacteria bacterium]|nr:bacteriohemerythrin [Pseudomonadota bacterium]
MYKGEYEQDEPNLASDYTKSQESIDKIIEAYSRFMPREFIGLMGKDAITGVDLGDNIEMTMTILFSDIRDFTSQSEGMTPQENFAFINSYLERMEPVIARHGGIIDKYIGDAIMALFPTNADDALHGAIGMLNQLIIYNSDRKKSGYPTIRIGVGLNTGLMMLGIIGGKHHMESTVISDAVNLASRIESMTKNYGTPLLISEHTYYGLKDASHHDTRFIDRVKVKGKEQCQSVYEVFDADPLSLREAKRNTKGLFEEALAYYHLKKVPEVIDLLSECLRQAPDDTVAQVYRDRCERFLATGIHESSGEVDLVIPWDESFAIGDPVIDAQHRGLFEHVNKFVEAIGNSEDYTQLHTIIEFLDEYVARHFATEERCMAENNYPFLQFQIDQHRRFSRYFDAFKDEIKKDLNEHRVFLLFRAQILVIDWLVNHTSKLDRHFGKFLKMADGTGSCNKTNLV